MANRIVLVNERGDEIFSGRSVLDALQDQEPIAERAEDPKARRPEPPPRPERHRDDDCPVTLRSGVFVRPQEDAKAKKQKTVDDRAA
jgi:hypothetical protein